MILAIFWLCSGSTLTKRGSITVEIRSDGIAVPGGTLVLYRVGELTEKGIEPTEEFALWTGELTPQCAQDLAQQAFDRQITGIQRQIGQDGRAVYGELAPGVYLLVQPTAALGWQKILPFFVCLPMEQQGQYVFDVVASPKAEPSEDIKIPETGDLSNQMLLLAAVCVFSTAVLLHRRGH